MNKTTNTKQASIIGTIKSLTTGVYHEDGIETIFIYLEEYPKWTVIFDYAHTSTNNHDLKVGNKYFFIGTMFVPDNTFIVRGVEEKFRKINDIGFVGKDTSYPLQIYGKFEKFRTSYSMRGDPVGFGCIDSLPNIVVTCFKNQHETCLKVFNEKAQVVLVGDLDIESCSPQFNAEGIELIAPREED